mmetsp:Transcript_128/g.506  ORF Transcript_128/g.506 Transcript_128/m.506 type:complete len:212 (-) Transcript_128:898-1533(-)
MGIAEVFVAKTASSFISGSTDLRTACFSSMSSKTASMKTSTEAARRRNASADDPAPSWKPCTSDVLKFFSYDVIFLRCTSLAQLSSTYLTPFATPDASRSFKTTAIPFAAEICAMPAPIRPAPRTQIVDGFSAATCRKRCFLEAVWPWKRPRRADDSDVAANFRNPSASRSKAALGDDALRPLRTQSMISNGAGYLPRVDFCTSAFAFLQM